MSFGSIRSMPKQVFSRSSFFAELLLGCSAQLSGVNHGSRDRAQASICNGPKGENRVHMQRNSSTIESDGTTKLTVKWQCDYPSRSQGPLKLRFVTIGPQADHVSQRLPTSFRLCCDILRAFFFSIQSIDELDGSLSTPLFSICLRCLPYDDIL